MIHSLVDALQDVGHLDEQVVVGVLLLLGEGHDAKYVAERDVDAALLRLLAVARGQVQDAAEDALALLGFGLEKKHNVSL